MSIQPLILKNGVNTYPRSPTDVNALLATIGLNNVNNTSDLNKPISSATQTALDLKANLVSPNFSGTPTTPTATAGTNTTQVANCAFVSTAISNLVASSPAALDTLNELAAALNNDANFSTNVTNSLASKVSKTGDETIAGIKTFSNGLILPSSSGSSVSSIWRNVDNLEYRDSTNTTRVVLNSAGNLSNLDNRQTALNNLVGTLTANRVLRSNGTNITLAQVALDTDVTNVLPIASGGTGSSTQNFVDLTTTQNISGDKYYLDTVLVGTNNTLTIQPYSNSDIKVINGVYVLNSTNGNLALTSNPAGTFACSNLDFYIDASSNTPITSVVVAGHYRVRNYATALYSSIQGLRLTALNSGTGNITALEGAVFTARNDTATTITTINGGSFNASISNIAGTATTINGGVFTATSGASALSTTVRGILITASSSNTTPATDCIGLDIASVTGTATNKLAIRTGIGRVVIGDTTGTTSTTTGALVVAGGGAFGAGLYAAGTINFSLPTSSSGLPAGSLWRNGNVVNIV